MSRLWPCINARPGKRAACARGSVGAGRLWLGAALALQGGVLALLSPALAAETLTVAVAANFLEPLRALETEFERSSGHELTVVPGSTGQLYAQIVNGAPFDILLAADHERPQRLVDEGLAEPDSLFTYAVGQLALWTRDPQLGAGLSLETLRTSGYRWLAIAQPEVAPYGAAALQVLEETSLSEALDGRIVYGQNITQAFTMAETGNADLALVALSQALAYEKSAEYFVVPPELHAPIRQDAVLLDRAASNVAAAEFLDLLRSPEAKRIIERFGYRTSQE